MGLFSSQGAVGLAFDTGVIRVVELKGSASSASLVAAGQVEIPESAVHEGTVVDVEALVGALGRLWTEVGISRRDVVLGMCNQGVLMRVATFPKIPLEKMAQALPFQAADYFPIPLNEMVLDFAVIGEKEHEGAPGLEIILVAARQDMLDKALGALAGARIQTLVIDASFLALLRVVPKEQLKGTVALADIGNGVSSLVLVSDGIPRFARIMSVSLQSLTRELGSTVAEALEAARQVAAAEDAGEAPTREELLLTDWAMALTGEIRSSLSYYLAQPNAETLRTVILSGRGASVAGLPAFLQEELGVPVEIVKPLANLQGVAQSCKVDFKREGADYATVVGLALRGLVV